MAKVPDASARAIHLLCEDVKGALARGELPADGMLELKRILDETRMRLWAAMEAAKSGDPSWVQEFWLQRAAEVCGNVVQHLERGELDPQSPRAVELRALTARLADALAPERS